MLKALEGLGEWDSFEECHMIQTSELGWPVATSEEYTQVTAMEALLRAGCLEVGGMEMVAVSSVHASCQGVVRRGIVQHYIDHPNEKFLDEQAPNGIYSPLAVDLVNGRRIMSDGNHRFVAALLRGDSEFRAYVLRPGNDMSEQTDWTKLTLPWHRLLK